MKKSYALTIILANAMLFGCKKEEPVVADTAAKTVLVAPADPMDNLAWQNYAREVVKRNMQGISERTFNYYLPHSATEGFQGQYQRQLEIVQGVVYRTVLPGNMLTFVSPDSEKMADFIVEAYALAPDNAMKGVRVLFIGKPTDNERVKAAMAHTNPDYVFVSTE